MKNENEALNAISRAKQELNALTYDEHGMDSLREWQIQTVVILADFLGEDAPEVVEIREHRVDGPFLTSSISNRDANPLLWEAYRDFLNGQLATAATRIRVEHHVGE